MWTAPGKDQTALEWGVGIENNKACICTPWHGHCSPWSTLDASQGQGYSLDPFPCIIKSNKVWKLSCNNLVLCDPGLSEIDPWARTYSVVQRKAADFWVVPFYGFGFRSTVLFEDFGNNRTNFNGWWQVKFTPLTALWRIKTLWSASSRSQTVDYVEGLSHSSSWSKQPGVGIKMTNHDKRNVDDKIFSSLCD